MLLQVGHGLRSWATLVLPPGSLGHTGKLFQGHLRSLWLEYSLQGPSLVARLGERSVGTIFPCILPLSGHLVYPGTCQQSERVREREPLVSPVSGAAVQDWLCNGTVEAFLIGVWSE